MPDTEELYRRVREEIATSTPEQVWALLSDRAYRDQLRDLLICPGIALQIRANRLARGWSQAELAHHAGLEQGQISLMENPTRKAYSIRSLKKVAEAFDCALVIDFVSFGHAVEAILRGPIPSLPFDEDYALTKMK